MHQPNAVGSSIPADDKVCPHQPVGNVSTDRRSYQTKILDRHLYANNLQLIFRTRRIIGRQRKKVGSLAGFESSSSALGSDGTETML
ncbi:MAG: hypothetical protein DMG67_14070 [Acidobacteria bacterium]|nr:MAG: hypothetical protein DMG67_14070 [Acidobacteriota bacterium]